MKMSRMLYMLCAVIVLMGTHQAFAQSVNIPTPQSLGFTDAVNVEVLPEFPKPGDRVRIVLSSSAADLDTALITWTVDGKVQKSAVGDKTFNIIAGKLGSKTTVSIGIKERDGSTPNQKVVITPSDMDILWEAHTYTPPFYAGKALYSPQSEVSVIAIPHIVSGGKEVSPSSLIYTWTINGLVLGDRSGYGRSRLEIPDAQVTTRPIVVEVEASGPGDSVSAYEKMTIEPTRPKILAYVDHPLFGVMLEHALTDDYNLSDKEVSLVGEPYFIATASGADVRYAWLVNNSQIGGEGNERTITLRNIENQEGNSLVSFRARSLERIFQSGDTEFTLRYSSDSDQ